MGTQTQVTVDFVPTTFLPFLFLIFSDTVSMLLCKMVFWCQDFFFISEQIFWNSKFLYHWWRSDTVLTIYIWITTHKLVNKILKRINITNPLIMNGRLELCDLSNIYKWQEVSRALGCGVYPLLYLPKNELQCGQLCSTFMHSFIQQGIRQHPIQHLKINE